MNYIEGGLKRLVLGELIARPPLPTSGGTTRPTATTTTPGSVLPPSPHVSSLDLERDPYLGRPLSGQGRGRLHPTFDVSFPEEWGLTPTLAPDAPTWDLYVGPVRE